MKKLIPFLLIISLPHAWAHTPESVLVQVDEYLGKRPFAETFVTGDEIKIRLDENAAGVKSETNTTASIDNTNDIVKVTPEAGVSEFSRHQWENNWQGNYARALVEKIESDGFKLDMVIADYPVFRLIFNGRPASLMAMKLSYTGKNSAGEKITGDIYVTSQLPGLGQIVGHRQIQLGIERYWSVISFKRATPFPNQ